MKPRWRYALEYGAVAGLLSLGRALPFALRGRLFALIGGGVMARIPSFRRRMLEGLEHVFPQWPEAERQRIARLSAANALRALSELLYNADYRRRTHLFHLDGPGLEALREARERGQGVLLISAHFGQWEAIRHALRAQEGVEVGALYRTNNNPFYETRFRTNIEEGGQPILPRGQRGTLGMVKHLKGGGVFALLADQKVHGDGVFDFLGRPALTTTAPAQIAARADLLLLPCFAQRREGGQHIDITLEAPVPVGDVDATTQALNDRITARIRACPEQWYWLHRRWSHVTPPDK